MTLEELRALYRENLLVEAIVEPFSDNGMWIVEFRHAHGPFILLTDDDGEECHYTNLDMASKSAMDVGFKQVRIESLEL
ncbi:hypothetical protein [Vibrio gazogenes]|uniref:Thymidylate kinase n=2 Tax=Vibrio gazogenes TaxID=687 RepID=A0A1M5HCH8_VIBGA|nr:hypothetical protein [Vibrio gazogenes]ASA55461.1 hypothetical protein BSQ33_06925 [Vibrio gazogenes]USP15334.1 hypothetical protein MKS89_13825 [Vibrio gazogenes]SHG13653.1 hypothetical protein SAMN02745781_04062 [Vibrio gazogenes DSM 21264] [Vibrio gazogenes DSM 21264 = NBRC 103151]SJN54157.1 hypothetical protein BQ6471_00853 [Vibrio gazogenes]